MANTSRPCSSAMRAVMSEPLCTDASTTRQPRLSPLMMRLRRGKVRRKRRCAQRKFGNDGSFLCQAMRQFAVGGRIDFVQTGTDHGNAGAGTLQAAEMRGRIDAMRHAADDAQSGIGDGICKCLGIAQSLGGSVAAADNRQ